MYVCCSNSDIFVFSDRYRKDRELASKAVVAPPAPKPRQPKKRTPSGKAAKLNDSFYDDDSDGSIDMVKRKRYDSLTRSELSGDERSSSVIMTQTPPAISKYSKVGQVGVTVPVSSQLSPLASDENVCVHPETKQRYYANHAGYLYPTGDSATTHYSTPTSMTSNTVSNTPSIGQSINSSVTPMGTSFQSNCIRAHHGLNTPKSSHTQQWSQRTNLQRDCLDGGHKPAKLKRRWLEAALEQCNDDEFRNTRSPSTTTSSNSDSNQYDIYINNNNKMNYSSSVNQDNHLNQYDNLQLHYQVSNVKHNLNGRISTAPHTSTTTITTHDDGIYYTSGTPPPSSTSSVRPSVLVMARSTSNSPSPSGLFNETNDTLAAAATLLNISHIIKSESISAAGFR